MLLGPVQVSLVILALLCDRPSPLLVLLVLSLLLLLLLLSLLLVGFFLVLPQQLVMLAQQTMVLTLCSCLLIESGHQRSNFLGRLTSKLFQGLLLIAGVFRAGMASFLRSDLSIPALHLHLVLVYLV